ncbi:hypothetical protein HK096_005897 [Nowakowskiella sp. JEL0078]|nr:hypothetical protein HK096_005897 [Nowakowskiella sp. JEL0078]
MKFATLSAVALSVLQLTSAAPLEARRFGQEQEVGLGGKISAVSSGCPSNGDGSLGFSGSEIKFLLAAADPCGKLTLADQVVTTAKTCPTGPKEKIIAIAMELVAAEKNFNPFVTLLDSVCLTPGLPASVELQGILQKVDPRTTAPNNNDAALQSRAAALNAKAESVLAAAQASGKGPGSGGKSLAQLLADNGFSDIQGFSGTGAGAAATTAAAAVTTTTTTTAAAAAAATTAAAATGSGTNCNAQTVQVVVNGNEQRFGLDGAQVALNPKVVLDRVCIAISRTNNQACTDTCNKAETAALALGVVGNSQGKGDLVAMQKLADDFNSALAGTTVTGTVIDLKAGGSGTGNTATTTTSAAAASAAETSAAVTASSLGSCSASAAQLVVKLGADPARPTEVRFIPGGFQKDPIFGGQGSALNGGIVANFICDRLNDQCKAPASTVTACRAAQLIVNGNKGGSNLSDTQVAALEKIASDFNAAIGIGSSDVADVATTTTAAADATTTTAAAEATTTSSVDIAALITLLQQAVSLLTA